ncbi:PAP2 superfamily protein [Candidatus Electronema halotolerans]
MLQKRLLELTAVTLFLVLISVVVSAFDADRLIISLVPRDLVIAAAQSDCSRAWPAGNVFPWNMLYQWAAAPAVLLGAAALAVLLAGFWMRKYAAWRKEALFILLLLALGPGLLINVLLKEEFGRARPREIVEFGGSEQFTPFWRPGTAGTNSSFPSGHAAIAFAALAPWFVLREKQRRTAALFLLLGLLFGTCVGVARMLQGAHFFSDILWAGGLVYLVGSLLALLMGLDSTDQAED